MAAIPSNEIARNFASKLDVKGYAWIHEIAAWVSPQEDGSHRVVDAEEVMDGLCQYMMTTGGFTESKLRSTYALIPRLQDKDMKRARLLESYIAFTDGKLDCRTFEFHPFPPLWDEEKEYARGDHVRFGAYDWTADRPPTVGRPPSSDVVKEEGVKYENGTATEKPNGAWRKLSAHKRLALVALGMTYQEALSGTDADCPKWIKFLGEMYVDENGKPDPEIIEIVSMMCGYALMPHLKANKMFMLAGPTASNGKSTFLKILKNIFPEGTVAEKKFHEFASLKGNNYGAADLIGKKLVICNEESSKDVDAGLIKELSDGMSEIQARRLYQMPFQFTPTFTIIAAFNTPPEFSSIDSGLHRRFFYIPCYAKFDGSVSLDEIVTPILEERQAILAWMIRNAKKLCENKWRFPKEPERMENLKTEMLTTQNSVLEFVTYVYEPLPKESTERGISCDRIYQEYLDFCDKNGRIKPYGKRKFFMMANSDYLGASSVSNSVRYRKCRKIVQPETLDL